MSGCPLPRRLGTTRNDWEHMRSTITDIWLNRARNRNDLIAILSREYGFIATPKTCITHLHRWGLHTYKKNREGQPAGSESTCPPPRKRKSRVSRTSGLSVATQQPQILARIVPGLANQKLPRAKTYEIFDFIISSIDKLILGVFGNPLLGLKPKDLLSAFRDGPWTGLTWSSWMEIADIYLTAEVDLRVGDGRKFDRALKRVQQRLQELVRPRVLEKHETLKRPFSFGVWQSLQNLTAPKEGGLDLEQTRWLSFFLAFWRVCHALIRRDTTRYTGRWFSLLTDFLQRLAWATKEKPAGLDPSPYFGSPKALQRASDGHRVYPLVYALCLVRQEDMRDVLRLGAFRTLEVLAPHIQGGKRRAVARFWMGPSH
ncbi:hypothetical protein B0T14DRAFT_134864 [Immersiella caudata]|uniref:Clr5 domain-containing protein n=1 Tax=Immersiella caudata TaxID=314043 RepID=A0AA39X548_9PEZI|nr:hypothetical protein B0T14DRAFT_134864 [Immersiella caudata]